MGRAVILIRNANDRQVAARWCQKAPDGTRIEFRATRRSLDQNSRLWADLQDISDQVNWYGQKLSSADWKDVFTASLRKARVVPGIDGGFVVLGLQTSKMTKDEFSQLLELVHAFGATHGVTFHDAEASAA